MLNSKDLCLIGHLRELQDAGVVSFKVEGRTKSVFYVATAGRVYKEAIAYFQSHKRADDELITRWVGELSQAGNRGFTEGFFNGRPDNSAYNYQSAQTQQTATFVATASENTTMHPDYGVLFTGKNPVAVGDIVTWTTPRQLITQTVSQLLDPHGLPVQMAQTNQRFYLTPPEDVSSDELSWVVLSRSQKDVACVS